MSEGIIRDGYLPVREFDPAAKGEVNLHSKNAVEDIKKLDDIGQAVEGYTTVMADPCVEGPPEGVPRILIVIPLLEVSFKFFKSWHTFWQSMLEHVRVFDENGKQTGVKYEIGVEFIYRKPVHIAETKGVNLARMNKCTHVLFMDDDIYDITPEMVDMLLEADKDVISGIMYASGFPFSLCAFRRYATDTTVCSQPAQRGMFRLYEVPCRCPHCAANNVVTDFGANWDMDFCPVCRKEIKDFAIQPVDLIPFPFTLMKTSVFDKIAKPWFHCNEIFPTDSWFADRCSEVGIQEYAHMKIRLNHRDINDDTKSFRYNESMHLASKKGSVVELTPEQMKQHQAMLEQRMELAEKTYQYNERPKFVGDVIKENRDVKKT